MSPKVADVVDKVMSHQPSLQDHEENRHHPHHYSSSGSNNHHHNAYSQLHHQHRLATLGDGGHTRAASASNVFHSSLQKFYEGYRVASHDSTRFSALNRSFSDSYNLAKEQLLSPGHYNACYNSAITDRRPQLYKSEIENRSRENCDLEGRVNSGFHDRSGGGDQSLDDRNVDHGLDRSISQGVEHKGDHGTDHGVDHSLENHVVDCKLEDHTNDHGSDSHGLGHTLDCSLDQNAGHSLENHIGHGLNNNIDHGVDHNVGRSAEERGIDGGVKTPSTDPVSGKPSYGNPGDHSVTERREKEESIPQGIPIPSFYDNFKLSKDDESDKHGGVCEYSKPQQHNDDDVTKGGTALDSSVNDSYHSEDSSPDCSLTQRPLFPSDSQLNRSFSFHTGGSQLAGLYEDRGYPSRRYSLPTPPPLSEYFRSPGLSTSPTVSSVSVLSASNIHPNSAGIYFCHLCSYSGESQRCIPSKLLQVFSASE